MQFQHPERDGHLELSLDDVFLLPRFYEGRSRLEVDLTPVDFAGGSHPVVSANMNAVTGKRMAETMARFGGLGVLPQDMEIHTVERIVGHIKNAHSRWDTALVVTPDATLRDVQGILYKRSHDMVVVVDERGRLVGIITSADLRDQDQYTPAAKLMSQRMVTVAPETDNRETFLRMEEERVKAAPVVDADNHVLGILTREDAVRLELLEPSLDGNGHLMVAAALGLSSRVGADAAQLVDIGVDALVLDTAHGHQRRMLEAIKEVRAAIGRRVPLVAGNVCTRQGTRALIEAGADVIKVNVGPGAMCTTRMQTGVGRPTFTAVMCCADEARSHDVHVWADGGVRNPRDVAIYLAAGASRVMVGTMLAGTYESPGDIKEDAQGDLYKVNYGMASARAVSERGSNLDAYERAKKAFFREGISRSRVYLREDRASVSAVLTEIITGLQSAFTYVGATDAESFFHSAVLGVQTGAGFGEGKPHGRIRR